MDLVTHDWNKKTRDRGDNTLLKSFNEFFKSSMLKSASSSLNLWCVKVALKLGCILTVNWSLKVRASGSEPKPQCQSHKDLGLLFISNPPHLHVKPWCLAKRRQIAPITAAWRSGFGSGLDVWRGTTANWGAVGSGLGSGAALSAVHRSH